MRYKTLSSNPDFTGPNRARPTKSLEEFLQSRQVVVSCEQSCMAYYQAEADCKEFDGRWQYTGEWQGRCIELNKQSEVKCTHINRFVDRAAYDACMGNTPQSSAPQPAPGIVDDSAERQRQVNMIEAQARADAAARAALEQQLSSQAEQLATQCQSEVTRFLSTCSDSSVRAAAAQVMQVSTVSQNAPTAEVCASRKVISEQMIQRSGALINQCASFGNHLNTACPSSTQHVTVTRPASVGGQNAEGTASGSAPIPQNKQRLMQAQASFGASQQAQAQMAARQQQVSQSYQTCMAQFGQSAPDTSVASRTKDNDTPTATAGNTNFDHLSLEGEFGDSNGSTQKPSNPIVDGLNAVTGIAGQFIKPDAGDYGAQAGANANSAQNPASPTPSAKLTPAEMKYNYQAAQEGGKPLDFSGKAGADDLPNLKEDDLLPKSPRQLASSNSRGGSNSGGNNFGGSSSSLGAMAMSPSAKSVVRNERRKSFTTAKKRNLIMGYKKVPGKNGAAPLTIHPEDYKMRRGSYMRKQALMGRDKYGTKTPLIFDGEKFVKDFLQMKEEKGFKKYNRRFAAITRGKVDPNGEVNPLDGIPIHQNPRLNIFQLMKFRYKKTCFQEVIGCDIPSF